MQNNDYDISFKKTFQKIFKKENISVNGRIYLPKLILYVLYLSFVLCGGFIVFLNIYFIISFSSKLGEAMTVVSYRIGTSYYLAGPYSGSKKLNTSEWLKKHYPPLEDGKYYVKGNGNYFKEINRLEAILSLNIGNVGFICLAGGIICALLYYFISYKIKT